MHSLFSKMMAIHFILLALIFVTLAVGSSYLLEDYFYRAKEREMIGNAGQLMELLAGSEGLDAKRALLDSFAWFTGSEAWIVDGAGRILMTSSNQLGLIGEQLSQDELRGLEEGQPSSRRGESPRFDRPVLSVALPYPADTPMDGGVFAHVPLIGVKSTIGAVQRLLVYAALASLGFAAVLSSILSRWITAPISHFTRAVGRMAQGEFDIHVDTEARDEVGRLGGAFNHLARKLRQSIREQREIEHMRRDFLINISHELRTPLTSVQGFLEAVLDGVAESPDETEEYLKIALDETERMRRLAHTLLDLSSIESGRLQLSPQSIPLRRIIVRVLDKLTPQIQDRSVEIALDLPGDLPPVWADSDKLEQILMNLVHNAVRYSPAGEIVAIKARRESPRRAVSEAQPESGSGTPPANAYVRITVVDRGPGIPEEEQPYIWERFYKTDKSRTFLDVHAGASGAGLGLAIVKELVEAHGGHVGIKSSPAEGCAFHFTLPTAAESQTP